MRKLTALLAAGLVLGLSGMAMANTEALSVTASADVITPIYVTQDTPLNFGKFSAGNGNNGAGTVVVDKTTGLRSVTGGVQKIDASDTSTVGAFTAHGADLGYSIAVTNATLTGAGTAMVATLVASKNTGTIASGTDTFQVGGSLAVPATQTAGAYSGSYTVTVSYQ